MWKQAQAHGANLEELAEELYNDLVKANMPEAVIKSFIYLVAEGKVLDDYFSENKLDSDKLPWILGRIKLHKHVDGQVVLPMEI